PAVHQNRLADYVGVGTITRPPKPIAEHHDPGPVRQIFIRGEPAAEFWRYLEQLREVRGRLRVVQMSGLGALLRIGEVNRVGLVGRDTGDGAGIALKREIRALGLL